jgi:hypothetical protein
MEGTRVSIENGKYTFCFSNNDYRVYILRYSEEWLTIEQGSKAILALMHRVKELEELLGQG